MNKKVLNKLIRDNIIDTIKKEGRFPNYRFLTNEEFIKELNKKLLEEVNEYIENNTIDELADVLEVIMHIIKTKNITFDEIEKVRIKKKKDNGSFEKRIYLIDIDDPSP